MRACRYDFIDSVEFGKWLLSSTFAAPLGRSLHSIERLVMGGVAPVTVGTRPRTRLLPRRLFSDDRQHRIMEVKSEEGAIGKEAKSVVLGPTRCSRPVPFL